MSTLKPYHADGFKKLGLAVDTVGEGCEMGRTISMHGPVYTQHDMTAEKIQELGKFYGAEIHMGGKIDKRPPEDSTVHDSWHRLRQKRKLLMGAQK